MQIIHHITMDMVQPQAMLSLDGVQGDGNTRQLALNLLENGKPWNVPEGVTAAVAFRKADGTRGLYDTLPDGTKAVTVSGNTVTAVLAPQVLSCAGEVSATVVFHDGKLNQLAAFPFSIWVKENPAAGQALSNDYYAYSTMKEVGEAVDAALASLETEKQAFLIKAEEALAAVHGAATEDAPAIECEANGEIITVTDASNRLLQGLTLYGKTLQNGTPTPDNPVPLESACASGSITVSVSGGAGVQTLTASTPNGLPGIPVSSDGNYTDASGRQWVCDEVDFARGVYVQRINFQEIKSAFVLSGGILYCRINKVGKTEPVICTHAKSYMVVLANGAVGAYTHVGFTMDALPQSVTDAASGQAYLDAQIANGTPVTVGYILTTPIETPLTPEELAAYAALHSNKPNTTVFNDGGAEMKLSYVADTKTYIDNKFAAISAAMLGA